MAEGDHLDSQGATGLHSRRDSIAGSDRPPGGFRLAPLAAIGRQAADPATRPRGAARGRAATLADGQPARSAAQLELLALGGGREVVGLEP
jgi:hypothetical protein